MTVLASDLVGDMSRERIREVVVRRVRLRAELKPVRTYWHPEAAQPDWLVISHVAGGKGHESLDLQLLKVWRPPQEGKSALHAPGRRANFPVTVEPQLEIRHQPKVIRFQNR